MKLIAVWICLHCVHLLLAMAESSDLRGPGQFNIDGDAASISVRFKSWIREFNLFADCKGYFNESPTPDTDGAKSDRKRRRALLLYCIGPKARDVFETFENTGDPDNYDQAVKSLTDHFNVTPNSSYLRHMFRKLVQHSGETVAQFVARLRTASEGCDFHSVDREIIDQVISCCVSEELRTKLLSKGDALNMTKMLGIAANMEAVKLQAKEMQSSAVNCVGPEPESPTGSANAIDQRSSRGKFEQASKSEITCDRCGYKNHYANSPRCPARGKTCRKCNGRDHFASKCKSGSGRKPAHKANFVEAQSNSEDENTGFAFMCQSNDDFERLDVEVGGVTVKFIVDSGCDTNIIGESVWRDLKKSKIKCLSNRKTTKRIYAYASDKPLKVLGVFTAVGRVGDRESVDEYTVVQHQVEPLLSKRTSINLGLLKIGYNVNSVVGGQDYEIMSSKYPGIFNGVGLMKDKEVKLTIDKSVTPVCQSYRRVPYGLREKVEDKLRELVEQDIIEPVEHASQWVSPVVVSNKENGDIRLCIDMRQANTAIVRERHPIPTVDELLLDMSKSNVFSKLDLKWGFHQLLLSEDSRDITTFVTHVGLFRYKRLLFGVSSAPEIYQNEIRKVVQGIPGVANMSDDMVVHGPNKAEHDKRLEQVFRRLEATGLTLNRSKCVFGVSEIDFLGHKLSDRGLDPGAGKVESVLAFRQPKCASEIRSFMGLVNYMGRFIPHLADLSEPLRKWTCKEYKDKPVDFGHAEVQAFNSLKSALANHETLGFFDVKADTMVFADASPVGLGAVLVQVQDMVPRVISYANRSLTDVEKRYSQTEKEALGLVWACERFQSYLIGIKFELITDHEPLLKIYGPKSKPSLRIERWVLRLQPFEFKVKYIKGKNNIADPLSRLVGNEPTVEKSQIEDISYVRFVAINSTPSAVTTRELERETARDSELSEVKQCLKYGNWVKFQGPAVYKAIKDELCVVGELLLRGSRIVVPNSYRSKIISLAHQGHLGMVGTKQNLRTKVYWPGMEAAAERYCRSCHGCQITSRGPNPEPLRTTKLPICPWADLAADFKGPLPNGEYILVVIDYYSRWFEVAYMKEITTEKTIQQLDKMFFTHGLPLSIRTDNGPQFISQGFKDYCASMGIRNYRVIPKWPQANGEVERQNESLLKRIQIAYSENTDYKSEISQYMTAYRSIPHPSTGKSPSEMLYGRKIRTKMPAVADFVDDLGARDHDSEYKAKAKLYTDERRGASYSDIQVGDPVLMKNYDSPKTQAKFQSVPVTVVDRQGPRVSVETNDGRRFDRNVAELKRYYTPECISVSGGGEGSQVDGDVACGEASQLDSQTSGSDSLQTNSTDITLPEANLMNSTPQSQSNTPSVDAQIPPSSTPTTNRGRSARNRQPPIWTNDYDMKR